MKAELKRERENMGKSDNIGGRPAGMPGRMRGIPGLEDQDRADNAWRTLGRLSGYFLREKLLIVAFQLSHPLFCTILGAMRTSLKGMGSHSEG